MCLTAGVALCRAVPVFNTPGSNANAVKVCPGKRDGLALVQPAVGVVC